MQSVNKRKGSNFVKLIGFTKMCCIRKNGLNTCANRTYIGTCNIIERIFHVVNLCVQFIYFFFFIIDKTGKTCYFSHY